MSELYAAKLTLSSILLPKLEPDRQAVSEVEGAVETTQPCWSAAARALPFAARLISRLLRPQSPLPDPSECRTHYVAHLGRPPCSSYDAEVGGYSWPVK
jgi:hypothetical protein